MQQSMWYMNNTLKKTFVPSKTANQEKYKKIKPKNKYLELKNSTRKKNIR